MTQSTTIKSSFGGEYGLIKSPKQVTLRQMQERTKSINTVRTAYDGQHQNRTQ